MSTDDASAQVIERMARRAILLTPNREVLLMQVTDPGDGWVGWITPGGGSEPGETIEQTLRRELHEELGLSTFEVGPMLWTREHRFSWEDRQIFQRETFHLVELARFEVRAMTNPDPFEQRAFRAFRWWAVAEIEAAREQVFVPRVLGVHLRELLSAGPPAAPFDVGI